ncbi:FecCD family ABC transporter permease [Bacillus sp. Hm123]|uniref:FecCD family ABC transporter permease n=1 Tax=Bacillus sp. Hm123 TaxID=3450745 RepID=UPI003F4244FB
MIDFLTVAQQKELRKTKRYFLLLAFLIIITLIISLNVGVSKLTFNELWQTLLGNGTAKHKLVLFDFRLPRMTLSLLVGAGLAASGCVLQGITKNDLADPGILGINAGAGLFVLITLTLFPVTTSLSIFTMPILAFIGSIITAFLIYILSYKKGQGIHPVRLLLTGIAIATGISSVMIVLSLHVSSEHYQFVANWLTGSIWGTDWPYVIAVLPFILFFFAYLFYKVQILNMIQLGDELAITFGVRLERERRLLLIIASGLAGASVAVGGGIAFIGLIAPHIARQLVGNDYKYLIGATALVGAWLVLFSDMLGRTILQPAEIPVGIVVAVVGAPYFMYLLIRSKS